MILTGLMLAAALFGQDDGPMVTATRAQDCILGGQPVECPPETAHPPVRQPTAAEVAAEERAEADLQAWLTAFHATIEPDWKTDAQAWLLFQCQEAPEGESRTQCEDAARLRLVRLRAQQIDARPMADPLPSPGAGGGVSVSTSLLDDDTERSSPRSQGSCDTPASGESNAAFVTRCPPGGGPRRD